MGSIPVRVMNKIPDLRIRDFFMQPVRGIEGTRPPAGGKKEPGGLFFSVRVPISRNVYRGCCTRKGAFNLTRTGIEQGGGAKHRNQSPSGALVSPGVPTARNVYCGCCRYDPYGNRTARPPIGGKQQSSGLLFSAGVPPCRNVYCGCCRFSLRPLPVKMRLERPAGRDKRK